MPTQLNDGQTILFIGDSITDHGRREVNKPWGGGYVRRFVDMLAVHEPEKRIRVINTGIGGNTIEDLQNRWFDDAISHRPDWMAIMIGINDVHRWLNNETEPQSPAGFNHIYDALIKVTLQELPDVKLLLIDPFYAGLDTQGKIPGGFRYRVGLELVKYRDTVRAMSRKFSTLHVRTHDILQEHLKQQHPSVYFDSEPVHPNPTGHYLIADAIYKTLGA